MNILFMHQNFPAQFKHLAPALVARGHQVVAMPRGPVKESYWQGVKLVPYHLSRGNAADIHPWLLNLETKVLRAEACFYQALQLKEQGFTPDIIIAHPSWGESLFVKDVWPHAKLGIYCEFYNQLEGGDVNFDPEFPLDDIGEPCRIRLKNATYLVQFESADAALSPTRWQANTYPVHLRDQISVIHDGIDTERVQPNPHMQIRLDAELLLNRDHEVITFVNRDLEPYRGYHRFMRALPDLLKRRPHATVLIVGSNGVSYGAPPPQGHTWKDIFIQEVRPQISDSDWQRVHFLGHLPYEYFLAVLQLSSVHVYLTYPFVLSWSLLEAMSSGCAIVASDTAPVREVIQHGDNGLLVDFFAAAALSQAISDLLDNPAERARLGANARAFIQQHYDLQTVCLPQQLQWVDKLANGS